MGNNVRLDQATLCRIWVRIYTASTLHTDPPPSWAIFHVVGANPKMKSELLFICRHHINRIQICTNGIKS